MRTLEKLSRRKLKSQKNLQKTDWPLPGITIFEAFQKNICKVVDGYKLENSKCYSQMIQDLKLEMRLRKKRVD